MNSDHARTAWNAAMPRAPIVRLPQHSDRAGAQGKGSKTTIIAMRTRGGVVMAADRRCTGWGYELVSEDEVKIDMIATDSALASCGAVASSQWIVDQLRVQARQFENTTGMVLSLRGQVRIAGELARSAYDGGDWFSFGGLFAGLDSAERGRIFEIEETGGRVEHHRYYATGSGGPTALAILRLFWRPDMGTKVAMLLAVKALYLAGLTNVGTSDMRLTLPTLVNIQSGRRGFAFATERVTRRLRDQVQRELEGVR